MNNANNSKPCNAADIAWIVPPVNQGQMVEVSYGQDEDGECWERTLDRSDRSVSYRYLGHASDEDMGTWEPHNQVPDAAAQ